MSVDGGTFRDELDQIERNIRNDIAVLDRRIEVNINESTNIVSRVIINTEDAILDTVINQSEATRAVVNARTADIVNAISNSTTILDNRISGITQSVEQAVEAGFQNVGAAIAGVVQDSLGKVEQGLKNVNDTVLSIGVVLKDQITSTQQQINKETDEIDLALQFSVVPRLIAAQRDIDSILKEQLDIDVAIRESTDAIIKQMQKTVDDSKSFSAFEAITFLLKTVFGVASPGPGVPLSELDQAYARLGLNVNVRELVGSILSGFKADFPIGDVIMNMITYVAFGWSTVTGALNVANERLTQEYRSRERTSILSPPDAMAAFLRGGIGEVTLDDTLARNGFPDHVIQAIKVLAQNLLEKNEIIQLWLRGELQDEGLSALLKQHGYTTDLIERLKVLAHPIPPIQDLIVMAVREVFTPNIVAKFGQDQDFPDAFKTFAAQQGLTEDWARRYWAAHWDLPSATMGFEMFHRRIISREELEILLRSLDVMPFWRDKLINLSFNPLTRVDIRRMHAVKVLDDDKVLSAYLDIGYSPENAQRLLEFTKKLNGPDEDAIDPELEKLTRATVTTLYEDGVISRQEAFDLLVKLGIGTTAADAFLILVDVKLDAEERKAVKDLILAQFDAGQLTFEEAQSRLGSAGLETQEQAKAVAALVKKQSSRTQLPNKSDLEKMFMAKIITEQEYLLTLQRLGFSAEWAGRFLKLAKSGDNDGNR